MKKLLHLHRSQGAHWVGDGFPVRSIFTYNDLAQEISPFLLMDYAAPYEFKPSPDHIRGVGEHPHRGFETVTIVYSGEVEHRDSAGGGGKIGPGDIQWMTAASGLVHEEKHGREFAKRGGLFEMVQLWVNLPAKDKMAKPRYQGIRDGDVPRVRLDENGSTLRVIAGEFPDRTGGGNVKGPAKTFSPIQLWDLRVQSSLQPRRSHELKLPRGYTTAIFVLDGDVRLGSGEILKPAELAILDREEEVFSLEAIDREAKLLVMGGEPLGEPIVGYGPFVMNSVAEIKQAMIDFEEGKMGRFA